MMREIKEEGPHGKEGTGKMVPSNTEEIDDSRITVFLIIFLKTNDWTFISK